MEHKCAENGNDHRLETASDGKWYLNRHWAISFCPYCGEKPEPPDVKIEVSRETLREWVSYARAIREHAVSDRSTSASIAARALEEWIKTVLSNDRS